MRKTHHYNFTFVFSSTIPPLMYKFAKLSGFLQNKKIKSVYGINQIDFQLSHGFSGIKHVLARESFQQLSMDYGKYLKNLKVKKLKRRKIAITFVPADLIPIMLSMHSFVNELYGFLDFFSLEINKTFNLGHGIGNCDFEKVCGKLKGKKYSKDRLARRILRFQKSKKYHYLHGLRNRMTHRFPMSFHNIRGRFFLFDDPWIETADPSTDKKYRLITKSRELLFFTLLSVGEMCDLMGKKLFEEWDSETKKKMRTYDTDVR